MKAPAVSKNILRNFIVRYRLEGQLYEQQIRTNTPQNAMTWVQTVIPNAKDIRYVIKDKRKSNR
jgi:peptidoglycan hydrolase-like amidase